MLILCVLLLNVGAALSAAANESDYRNGCPSSFVSTRNICVGQNEENCKYIGGLVFGDLCIIDKTILPTPLAKQVFPKRLTVKSTNLEDFQRLSVSENLHAQATCGIAKFLTPRVANGYIASLGQFPWVVDIELRPHGRGNPPLGCTGVLISQRHILTAKHCVVRYCQPFSSTVLKNSIVTYNGICRKISGSCNPTNKLLFASIRRVVFPSDRLEENCLYKKDFALIELDRNITFTDTVKPICVAKLETENMIDTLAAGYGYIIDQIPTTVQRYMRAQISQRLSDMEITTFGLKSFESSKLSSSLCPGDSGGPLQASFKGTDRAYLAGLTSRGTSICGRSSFDTIHTFVPPLADWLCQQIGLCEL